jgi:hypothetical protein
MMGARYSMPFREVKVDPHEFAKSLNPKNDIALR